MSYKTLTARLTRGDSMTQPGGLILRERLDDEGTRYAVHSFARDRGNASPRAFFWGHYSDSYAEALAAFSDKLHRAARYQAGGSLIPAEHEAAELAAEIATA